MILTVLDHPGDSQRIIGCLADLVCGARINVLAVRVPPASTVMPTEEVLTQQTETDLRAREAARVAVLKAKFEAWNATGGRPGGSAEWFDREAVAARLVAEWGKRADIVVVQRPRRDDDGTTGRCSRRRCLRRIDRCSSSPGF